MEIGTYPGPKVLKLIDTKRSASGRQELHLEFENEHFYAKLGEAELEGDELSLQTAGGLYVAAWHAEVVVEAPELVCRDTIEWD